MLASGGWCAPRFLLILYLVALPLAQARRLHQTPTPGGVASPPLSAGTSNVTERTTDTFSCGTNTGEGFIGEVILEVQETSTGRCCLKCRDVEECQAWVHERDQEQCILLTNPTQVTECKGSLCVAGIIASRTDFKSPRGGGPLPTTTVTTQPSNPAPPTPAPSPSSEGNTASVPAAPPETPAPATAPEAVIPPFTDLAPALSPPAADNGAGNGTGSGGVINRIEIPASSEPKGPAPPPPPPAPAPEQAPGSGFGDGPEEGPASGVSPPPAGGNMPSRGESTGQSSVGVPEDDGDDVGVEMAPVVAPATAPSALAPGNDSSPEGGDPAEPPVSPYPEEVMANCRGEGVMISANVSVLSCEELEAICGAPGEESGAQQKPHDLRESPSGDVEEACSNLKMTSCVNSALEFASEMCTSLVFNGPAEPSEACPDQPFAMTSFIGKIILSCRSAAGL